MSTNGIISGPVKFALWFIGLYVLMQLGYSGYLWYYSPNPDPITILTAKVLAQIVPDATLQNLPDSERIRFLVSGKPIVNILEGCNGISVVIALVSFMLAFKKLGRFRYGFFFLAVILLLLANILRLYLLVYIRLGYPAHFDLFHEYLFPAILYLVAFVFMVIWVRLQKGKE